MKRLATYTGKTGWLETGKEYELETDDHTPDNYFYVITKDEVELKYDRFEDFLNDWNNIRRIDV